MVHADGMGRGQHDAVPGMHARARGGRLLCEHSPRHRLRRRARGPARHSAGHARGGAQGLRIQHREDEEAVVRHDRGHRPGRLRLRVRVVSAGLEQP